MIAAVIGDGDAETGALATSWHSNNFLRPTNADVVRTPAEYDGKIPEVRDWVYPRHRRG